jgi:hypothetical protein
MGLSLLATASMPMKYWDQAFLTAMHLINRTLTKRIGYDTPLHKLLNINLNYSNFCVFGCACWPNLRPHNTHKLQFRSIWCTFHGYSNLHKGINVLTSLPTVYTYLEMLYLMNKSSHFPIFIPLLALDIHLNICSFQGLHPPGYNLNYRCSMLLILTLTLDLLVCCLCYSNR